MSVCLLILLVYCKINNIISGWSIFMVKRWNINFLIKMNNMGGREPQAIKI